MLFSPDRPYHLRFVRTRRTGQPDHVFCGPNHFPGAGCPNCRQPLQVFATLDTTDPRLSLPKLTLGPQLPLLWCWCCPILRGPFTYAVHDGQVTLLAFKKGRPDPNFPYEGYPRPLPGAPAVLIPISNRADRLISEIHGGHSIAPWRYRRASIPIHQIGGIPYLVQGPEYQDSSGEDLSCPTCRNPMPLLASIGNRCLDARGMCGNDFVQVLFHFCPDHGTVTAIQQCD